MFFRPLNHPLSDNSIRLYAYLRNYAYCTNLAAHTCAISHLAYLRNMRYDVITAREQTKTVETPAIVEA